MVQGFVIGHEVRFTPARQEVGADYPAAGRQYVRFMIHENGAFHQRLLSIGNYGPPEIDMWRSHMSETQQTFSWGCSVETEGHTVRGRIDRAPHRMRPTEGIIAGHVVIPQPALDIRGSRALPSRTLLYLAVQIPDPKWVRTNVLVRALAPDHQTQFVAKGDSWWDHAAYLHQSLVETLPLGKTVRVVRQYNGYYLADQEGSSARPVSSRNPMGTELR